MKLPGGNEPRDPHHTIVRYLLALGHPETRAKAPSFLLRRYHPRDPPRLIENLRKVAARGTVTETLRSEHDVTYDVDEAVEIPDGNRVRLRAVWFVGPHDVWPRYVTACRR